MSRCTGWLVELRGGAQAVLGQGELLHLIRRPETHPVPCAPAWCRRVLVWEQDVLPVFDVGGWSDPAAADIADPVVAIVGFRSDAGHPPQFGGLLLASTPQRIDVDDAAACALPLGHWRRVACACFERDGRALPVLDLARLFALDPGGG